MGNLFTELIQQKPVKNPKLKIGTNHNQICTIVTIEVPCTTWMNLRLFNLFYNFVLYSLFNLIKRDRSKNIKSQ